MGHEFFELMTYTRLFGLDAWLNVVFLAGLFAIAIYKRELIHSRNTFRWASYFFAASLVAPSFFFSIIHVVTENSSLSGLQRGGAPEGAVIFVVIANSAGPILFALALFCLIASIMPRQFGKPENAEPEVCPLDRPD